jgi:SAM-dependent methyltransferase
MKGIEEIKSYYDQKIIDHGPSPQGVDWNGKESQAIRFEQLLKIAEGDDSFSLNDFGCGYGALYTYADKERLKFDYYGNDISLEMVRAAQKSLKAPNAIFNVSEKPCNVADYTVASGVFNVALHVDKDTWKDYVFNQLNILNEYSRKGFSFNCLTSYSDEDKKKPYLYYADPCEIFAYCKEKFSKNVALLHDYDLYEFTILVRKQ